MQNSTQTTNRRKSSRISLSLNEWPWYLKLVLAFITIFSTYNTFSNTHLIGFIKDMDYTNLFNYGFIFLFAGFWLVMLFGIYKNLKKWGVIGLMLVLGLFGGGAIQKGWINLESENIVILLQVILSLVFFFGLIWPDIRKKLFGVRVVDEEDTNSSDNEQ